MNTRKWWLVTGAVILALVLAGGSVWAKAPLPASQPVAAPASLRAGSQLPSVIINEVMPTADSGQYEWVELYNSFPFYTLYLPLVIKNYSGSQAAQSVPSGAIAPLGVNTAGWQVSDEDGNVYTIPSALPPVPPRAYVLIYFDGLGPAYDDYDFSDGKAVLHTPSGLTNVFNDTADQVALYRSGPRNASTIVDFVAYGASPGTEGDNAVAAGLWQPSWWVNLYIGSGAAEEGAAIAPNRSLGLYPGHSNNSPHDWAIYQGDDLTPGAANPVPRAYWSTVADGAVMGSDGFALGWPLVPGATYQLQMDDDPSFGSPRVDVILNEPWYVPATPPPAGSYWWRVRAIDAQGRPAAWSTPTRVTVIAIAGAHAAGDEAKAQAISPQQVVLGITWLRQRKDTPLLCLDGDNEGNPAAPSPKETWDAVHPDAIYVHGRNNCVRASIAMIVTNYGGDLSQDRLSYQLFENNGSPIEDAGQLNNPLLDLGHDHTTLVCGGDGSNGGTLLAWALGINKSDYTYGHINTSSKPSFAQIRTWIDAGRPIMRFHGGHQTVIGGYRTLGDGTQQVRLFDPWSAVTWENYSGVNITCWYVPPAAAPGVRSDEPGIWTDADGDGVMDWDEQNRFYTQATSADSDSDWVQDKQDIREYVFDTAGTYSLRNADFDGDGDRKELDDDNDNDGSVDGCEDTNYNGKYEAALGETDNFNAASRQDCVPEFDILQPTQTNPVNAGAYNGPDKILVQVKTATPPSSPVVYVPGDFDVEIGGLDSPVLAVYQVFDTHFLVVNPHTQPAADYYDLEVTLQGTQSDTETRAVYYLPKLRADQMLVIDRSGSMLDYDKIDAAKNAARAFVDHTNVGDMIGVVSFASSAGPAPDYPLTTVTGDPEWDVAKAAVNGLTASGMTALGQGALLGYNQIIASGQADHDWAMALLSDGMENVAPYWGDAAVSGVIVPSRVMVHTVALGRDADRNLMAAIAGSTGGTSYEAGVDVLPLTASASSAALPGPNLPSTLPNRLADVYKAIGEEIGHQQRLWEQTGRLEGSLQFEVPVEKGLPEAIFAVNWDDPGSPIQMTLWDPNGNQIKPGQSGVTFQDDTTHQQYRIERPEGGKWVVKLVAREKMANYLFILSAWSPTTMHLAFGVPPQERAVGVPIPILVVLADEKPIKGAEVWALVQGPNSDLVELLQLFDDGMHQDGRKNDGVYGNVFTKTYAPGAYVVKASGWGVNNYGEEFVRHRTGSFYVLPRVAYIWLDDLVTTNGYKALLEANGFVVDFVHIDDVPKFNFFPYSLIVIGPETGDGAEWGTSGAVGNILQWGKPVLGLGEGGYAFFGQLKLDIGHPYGWHGNENQTYVMDTAHQVWHSPYHIPLPKDRVVTIYKRTAHVGIHIPKPPADVTLIGREPADQTHYNLVQQAVRYLLWGFHAGPVAMTEDGRHLFINVARYLVGR